jgi:hypothetical protein
MYTMNAKTRVEASASWMMRDRQAQAAKLKSWSNNFCLSFQHAFSHTHCRAVILLVIASVFDCDSD